MIRFAVIPMIPNIKPHSLLKDDLGLDSVDLMDSICLLEERFNIKMVDSKILQGARVESVQDIAELVKRTLAKPAS